MSAVLERQRWFAGLALLVAPPLALTGVASWPFVAAFAGVAALVLASRRAVPPLRPWMENLLAPLILVAVVAAGGLRYGVLRPVAQLAILVAAVRLPGCGERSRGALTATMLGIVGVAGIASSTHPTLAAYLLLLLAFVLVMSGRLVAISLAGRSSAAGGPVAWPPARQVGGSVVLAALVAVPVFLLLPRLRSPFAGIPIDGRSISGFRDAVALHGIGDVKLSRRVVLRVAFPETEKGRVSPDWLRLAGATMRRYRAGSWVEGRLHNEALPVRPGADLELGAVPPHAKLYEAEITLEADTSTVFLPPGAVSLHAPDGLVLFRDPGGSLRTRRVDPPLEYGVRFDPRRLQQPPPEAADVDMPPDSGRVRELATRVARQAPNPLAAALAIEQHLQHNYGYSLSSHAPVREDPVQWFLFRSREGHCEFFASSMVLMLRSLGIPARLQAGFAGGERSGGEFVVRDSDAHAWVVAWIDARARGRTGSGGWAGLAAGALAPGRSEGEWRVFDPTPPEGRPGVADDGGHGLRLGWQSLETAWDRWVLTFSLADQLEGLRRGIEAVGGAMPRLLAVAGLVAVLAVGAALRRAAGRRRPAIEPRIGAGPAVSRALARAYASCARAGVVLPAGATPRELAGVVRLACPVAASPLAWLVETHERCRYAGGATPAGPKLRQASRAIDRALRRGASSRRA
ncbi:MAG TPA: transglutaminaseTgpA domain-containing protein [Thermoanaerobaculaceae bacterium]|nr:transglutaminaseTgpA domain-containing protein [Thermoanaerobaculaceae bacterium]